MIGDCRLRGERRPFPKNTIPVDQRLLGNFPQAFSHFSMVNTAFNLEGNTSASPSDGSRHTKIK
jgi:hypothetical protein